MYNKDPIDLNRNFYSREIIMCTTQKIIVYICTSCFIRIICTTVCVFVEGHYALASGKRFTKR